MTFPRGCRTIRSSARHAADSDPGRGGRALGSGPHDQLLEAQRLGSAGSGGALPLGRGGSAPRRAQAKSAATRTTGELPRGRRPGLDPRVRRAAGLLPASSSGPSVTAARRESISRALGELPPPLRRRSAGEGVEGGDLRADVLQLRARDHDRREDESDVVRCGYAVQAHLEADRRGSRVRASAEAP